MCLLSSDTAICVTGDVPDNEGDPERRHGLLHDVWQSGVGALLLQSPRPLPAPAPQGREQLLHADGRLPATGYLTLPSFIRLLHQLCRIHFLPALN